MSVWDKVSKVAYYVGRKSRDAKAIGKAIKTMSPKPLIKRAANKWIGRNIISKMWLR